jgi:hypothetical protein
MAFVIWSRRSMSSQRIRFVEARTARTIAIIGLIALLIAALALGIAIGTIFARSHLGEEQALAWPARTRSSSSGISTRH